MDTFDPKPLLDQYDGKDPGQLFNVEPTQFNNTGALLASPWKFNQHGESGIPVSELFPHVATCVDELAVVRSMTSNFPEHTFANYFLHTGSGLQGRPSMGAWVNYGLGSECQNLPGFIALNGGLIPPGGLDCFGSGFLPARYQGSVFKPSGSGVANITPPAPTRERQRGKLDLINQLDSFASKHFGQHDAIESAIRNYELASAMQLAVPEVMSLTSEPAHLQKAYGLESEFAPTKIYAAQCLIARRMIEKGVRFIELTCPKVGGDRWDQHGNLKHGHEIMPAPLTSRSLHYSKTCVNADCWTTRSSSGPGSLVGHHLLKARTVAITTSLASRSGWLAVESNPAPFMAQPTSLDTRPSRTEPKSTICMPQCSTCWVSITPAQRSASAAAICA